MNGKRLILPTRAKKARPRNKLHVAGEKLNTVKRAMHEAYKEAAKEEKKPIWQVRLDVIRRLAGGKTERKKNRS